MKIFYSFLIVFLFSMISSAQSYNEVIFNYPDYLCPEIEDIVIHSDDNGQVDLSEFLINAKDCLNQSDYDYISFVDNIGFELEVLCDSGRSSCLENLRTSISEVQEELLKHQEDRILYPPDYQEVGELDEYREIDGGEETCTCNDSYLARMLIYGNEEQHNRVMNRLKLLGTSCLRAVFDTLIYEERGWGYLQTFDIPNSCQEQQDHPVCRKLDSDTGIIQQRILSLVRSINDSKDLDPSYSNPLNNGISSEFVSGVKNHLACSEYAVGEERQLNGLNQGERYLIKRESENHYTASVAVRFTSVDVRQNEGSFPFNDMTLDFNESNMTLDSRDEVYDHHVHTHYMQKARECIKEANTKMLGPNGERLEIVLKDANEVNACEYQHNILIVTPPGLYGANYKSYPSDIDNCAFITHEILHIFGLSDEYYGFNMRPIPHPVANTHNPLEDQVLLYKLSGISKANSSDDRDDIFCEEDPMRPIQHNSIMANIYDRWDNVFKFRRDKSLLDPTHFNAILYGDNCTDRKDVQLYNQCYEMVFSSGQDCSIIKNKLSECRRANVLGRTQQRELEILGHELSTNQESYRHVFNLVRERSRIPVIMEENAYESIQQLLLERLEAVRGWNDESQSQK